MLFGLAGVSLLPFALVPMHHHGPSLVALPTLFVGAGLGSTMPAAPTMVQWAAGDQELGEATAVLSFSRSVGGVLGTAITSAVLLCPPRLASRHHRMRLDLYGCFSPSES
jgi:MFS family permease